MTNPTIDQKKKRYAALPDNIQVVLFLEDTTNTISSVSEENGLSREQIPQIATTAGLVLLGFLKISGVAQEIQERTGLPIEKCQKISAYLENKIFNSIRADLDKIYAPPEAEPVKMGDIKTMGPKTSTGSPSAATQTEKTTVAPALPPIPSAPKFARPDFIKDTKGAPLPSPKPLGDIVKPQISPVSPPVPPAISSAIPPIPAPAKPADKPASSPITGFGAQLGGVAPTGFTGRTISPTPTELPSQAPLRPAVTAAPKLDIKLGSMAGGEISKLGGLQARVSGTAKIEIGQTKAPIPNPNLNVSVPGKEQIAQKIVNYSQWKTPIIQPPAPAGQPVPTPLQNVISKQINNPSGTQAQNLSKLPPPPPPPLKK